MKDIEETKSGKVGSGVLNVGLPAYVILNALLRSAKANSVGLVLSKYTRGNDLLHQYWCYDLSVMTLA